MMHFLENILEIWQLEILNFVQKFNGPVRRTYAEAPFLKSSHRLHSSDVFSFSRLSNLAQNFSL